LGKLLSQNKASPLAQFRKNFFAAKNNVCGFNENHAPSASGPRAPKTDQPREPTQRRNDHPKPFYGQASALMQDKTREYKNFRN